MLDQSAAVGLRYTHSAYKNEESHGVQAAYVHLI